MHQDAPGKPWFRKSNPLLFYDSWSSLKCFRSESQTMSSTIFLPRIPYPTRALTPFIPFISWALSSINYRLKTLGVDSPGGLVRNALFTDQAAGLTLSELGQRSLISPESLTEIATVHDVVQQAGWLTCEEYCQIVAVLGFRGEDRGYSVLQWAETPK